MRTLDAPTKIITGRLGSMARSKHIGTEIPAGDGILGSEFDGRPPLSTNQNLVVQPVPNQLLGGSSGATAVLSHLGGEGRLPARKVNRAPKRIDMGNVVYLHDAEFNTTFLVGVNKNAGLTRHKEACRVLSMPTPKKKPSSALARSAGRRRVSAPEVGPDGLTLPQRLHRLMAGTGIGQTELARMCSELYSTFVPASQDKVKQQHIFNLLQGQSNAWCLPLVATVFDVNDMWLQFGIGPKERKKN